jgi:tetratricopeptide (TPR) repeat protein
VIPRFLAALNVPPQQVPADPAAQAGLYRTLLADRRVLVVLDNARDPDQVRPLLPGTTGCLALVTSRNPLTGLVAIDGAQPLRLDLLSPEEARDLLSGRLGADRVAAEPDAVEELIAACARLPLALAIAAARAGTQPDAPLAAFATELRAARGALDALTGDDPATDIRAVFDCSYRALSPPAARLFRLLGLHPAADIPVPAAASLAGLPAAETAPMLAELTRAHLVTAATPGRYGFHDLLREYARELAHREDSAGERRAAVHRYLDHYLHTAYAADRQLHPARRPIALNPAEPGVTPAEPGSQEQATDWFTAEEPALLAAVNHAAAAGLNTYTWQLAWTLSTFLDYRGQWHDWTAAQQLAVAAAGRLGDPPTHALTHAILAGCYTRLDRFAEAHDHLAWAIRLYQAAGDRTGEAFAHVNLSRLAERQRDYPLSLDHGSAALDLFRATDHQLGQALALNLVGWCHAHLDRPGAAVAACRQALALHEHLDDPAGHAAAWDSLGYAQHRLGDHAGAAASYRSAIEGYRGLGDRYEEAATLTNLGDTHDAAGDPEAAGRAWLQALAILTDLEHPQAAAVREKLAVLSSRAPRRAHSAG